MSASIADAVRAKLALTAQDLVHAPAEVEGLTELAEYINARTARLTDALAGCVEALETLKVAVNDKVNDPGATAFIERALAKVRAVLEGK